MTRQLDEKREADVSGLEAEIDALVFGLYGLTAAGRTLAEGGGK